MKRILAFLAFSAVAAFGQVGTFGSTGQQAVTGSAVVVAIPAGLATVCIKALPGNTSPAVIYLGSSSSVTTSTGYPLSASESACVPVAGGQRIYVIASGTGSSIAWLGTVQ